MKTPAKIIDHKKVQMTNDEYDLYEEICKGYDKPNFNGKDLFQDHFEVDDHGIIILVKPPHKKYSSLEVYTFLISLQVNQQLRIARDQMDSLVREAEAKVGEVVSKLEGMSVELESTKKEVQELKVVVEKKKRTALKE